MMSSFQKIITINFVHFLSNQSNKGRQRIISSYWHINFICMQIQEIILTMLTFYFQRHEYYALQFNYICKFFNIFIDVLSFYTINLDEFIQRFIIFNFNDFKLYYF